MIKLLHLTWFVLAMEADLYGSCPWLIAIPCAIFGFIYCFYLQLDRRDGVGYVISNVAWAALVIWQPPIHYFSFFCCVYFVLVDWWCKHYPMMHGEYVTLVRN